ncbi:hypothetical protein BKA56DRAFT_570104 [Ilyonectria sp. MPI-CAGE-AT-0026]|nr:hypothetical protein BKA56DRAFT_570104 [Ilyonectria sp. MPI-CAGE-AT-0026]
MPGCTCEWPHAPVEVTSVISRVQSARPWQVCDQSPCRAEQGPSRARRGSAVV